MESIQRELKRRRDTNWLRTYRPYPRQVEFHNNGAWAEERLFMAGNQLGKTIAGGAETALHLTGRYPDWWEGAVFEKPTKFWIAGVTGESTRDNPQRVLVGPPQIHDAWGTGTIPADALVETRPSRGLPDSLDAIVVRHGGGGDVQMGESIGMFKSYEKGRQKWQGDTIDGLWCDEEPPADIYSEGKTRTNNGQRGNFTLVTFTPLLGLSSVVRTFLDEDAVQRMG